MTAAFLGLASGERIALMGKSTVGRSVDCGITFEVPALSRTHAEIEPRTGGWWLRDLRSKNGTFVNGAPIGTEAVCLRDSDLVVFAGAVSVTFHDPSATPIAPRIGRLQGVWIDPATSAVWVDAVRVEPPLSHKQLELLRLLDAHRGAVVSRPSIVAHVWPDDAVDGITDDAVSALIKRLRARLREGPLRCEYVDVVRGRGFASPSRRAVKRLRHSPSTDRSVATRPTRSDCTGIVMAVNPSTGPSASPTWLG